MDHGRRRKNEMKLVKKIIKNTKIKSPGIYQIESFINGKIYIGSSIKMSRRVIDQHFARLKNGDHHNQYLQNHVNKYGIKDLWADVVEFCPEKELIEREQYYIDTLKPAFNINKIAGPFSQGEKHPKFWKDKKFSEEHRQKMSENHADFSGKNHYTKRKGYKPKEREKHEKGYYTGAVKQYSLDGIFIKTYLNQTKAAKQTGICVGDICNCIHNKTITAGGFIWKQAIK